MKASTWNRQTLPFSALLGQQEMRLALLLNAVDPLVGGVLLRGEKGTGKSTAVRALAALLPDIDVVRDCPFSCNPASLQDLCPGCAETVRTRRVLNKTTRPISIITLPLNATEDAVTGTIDLKKAVQDGVRMFQPGILAAANRGILYIDEINLLDDHLADIILDSAASGINRVEREGISFIHPSRFIMAGTMNPEEGDLRAQLLDRFGLCVDIQAEADPEIRVQLMEIREAFDKDPESVRRHFAEEEKHLAGQIVTARKKLEMTAVPDHVVHFIAELCSQNNTAGHRADLIMLRSARAYTALEGREETTIRDVQYVARFVLLHRSRLPRTPHEMENHGEAENEIRGEHSDRPDKGQESRDVTEVKKKRLLDGTDEEEMAFPTMKKSNDGAVPDEDTIVIEKQQVFEIGDQFTIRAIPLLRDTIQRRSAGKRHNSASSVKEGRYVRSRPAREYRDIAFDASIRSAAPFQRERRNESDLAVVIRDYEVQEKVREKKVGNFFLFIVDASGSMAARQRMIATKGAIFSLLMDAYQKRDKAAMVTFQKRSAEVLLPPTSSIDLAGKLLKEMPVGGRTPLSHGLLKGYSVLHNYLLKEPDAMPVAIIITDGKANIGLENGTLHGAQDPYREALGIAERISHEKRVTYIVVDTLETRQANLGTARRLADSLKAQYFKIEDLKTTELVQIARSKTS